jgi:aspartyl-tRNA(Asn)/glutamyl-tRNA(Gln) amidotransferase subunit A
MTEIHNLTAADLVRLYRRRELSPVDVTRDVLARIERFNPIINAFNIVIGDAALAAARESEARWHKGEPRGLVDGVPATIKDNIWVAGLPCRKGSATTDTAPVAEDAPSVARLREQGSVIVGKTTLPEFGWIGACHSPLTGITRNPWDLDRTPGGSSGGAAAAALLNLGWLHIGTDGAGSIRIPAAFTGVFGIKPSFGRVAAYPASPFAALAHQGPLTRTVTDAATMLSVISAPDERDMAAWNTPAPDFRVGLDEGVKGLRIAWSPRLGHVTRIDPEVEASAATAARVFEDLGAHVEQADPDLAASVEAISTLWGAVSATIVDGIPKSEHGKMDPGFLRMADRGRRYSLAQFLQVNVVRSDLAKAMVRFHQRYDLLLTPQMAVPALEAGLETPASSGFGESWVDWSPFTYPFNLTQQPAASVPCGFTSEGLPVGLQIVGPARNDALVLRAARSFESARPFATLAAPRNIPEMSPR